MGDEKHKNGSSINWGGLAKGILAGAAIVAGILLVFPGITESLAASYSGAPELLNEGVQAVIKGIGSFGSTIGGAILAWVGYKQLTSSTPEEPLHRDNEATEDFRTRLEMDRMNNLMTMRAAYAGNPEAQAMLQQQGRS